MSMNYKSSRYNKELRASQKAMENSNVSANCVEMAGQGNSRHDATDMKVAMGECPQGVEVLLEKHKSFMLHLAEAKGTLLGLGAEEDVELLAEVEARMARKFPG